MADIWLCRDGAAPTFTKEPVYVLSVDECVRELGLSRSRFLSSTKPTFNWGPPQGDFGGTKHAVVEVAEGEAPGWRAGFYVLRLHPSEVRRRMDQQSASTLRQRTRHEA